MMEDNKKETKTTNKRKTTTRKVETGKQESIPQQMSMEQMQQMMMSMMQMMNSMQQAQSQVSEDNIKKEQKTNKKKWSKVDLYDIEDERVFVTSVSDNVVYKSSKNGIVYRWLKAGDRELLTVREIINMDNTSKRFLRTPWLKVTDDRVIEALGLQDLYALLEKVEDIDSLINMSTPELERVFERLPSGYKEDFRDNIVSKIRNKELRDLSLIEVLSDVLDMDLKNM